MKWLRRFLCAAIGVEVAAAVLSVGMRLNSTRIEPLAVEQYHDALTGRELTALPDQFLFDCAAKWRAVGEANLAYGHYSRAEACLAQAAQAAPRDAEIAFAYALCLEREGKLAESNTVFQRLAASANRQWERAAWYHMGRNHLRLEQSAHAASAFVHAGDQHLPSVYQRAKLLVRHGQANEAEPLLELLAANHPRDIHVWQLRAQAADSLGHDGAAARARAELDCAAATLELSDADGYLNAIHERIGLAREVSRFRERRRAGASAAALTPITRLLDQDSTCTDNFPPLLQETAAAHVAAGNLETAETLLHRQLADQEFPTAIAWELCGDLALSRGDSEGARQAWERAVHMGPSASVHRKLARLCERNDERSESRRHFALAGLLIAMEYYRNHQFERARAILQEAVIFDDSLPHVWYYSAATAQWLGDQAAAGAACQTCLDLNPCHGRSRRILEGLNNMPR